MLGTEYDSHDRVYQQKIQASRATRIYDILASLFDSQAEEGRQLRTNSLFHLLSCCSIWQANTRRSDESGRMATAFFDLFHSHTWRD